MKKFNCTTRDVREGFEGKTTLLCISFSWSPSSEQLSSAVRDVTADLGQLGVQVRLLDGDGALEFCTQNGVVAGAGAVKVYDAGREVCVRRANGSVAYTIHGLLRGTQVVELVEHVLEAKKEDAIANVSF